MHFTVAPVAGGFAVAYHRPNGELCAVSDHATSETAEKEVQRLNAQYWARRAAVHAERNRQQSFAELRPLRWFEPDAFA